MSLASPPVSLANRQVGPSAIIRRSFISFIFLAILSTSWALASPLMSVPDEPAHTIKAAAVARGELTGYSSGQQGEQTIVTVPRYIAYIGAQLDCFGTNVSLTPDCAPPIDANARDLVQAPTSAGNYNPMYYALIGLPSRLMGGAPAVYLMRIIGALACAGFLAVAIGAAASMRRRFWPLVSSLTILTPMVLFLSGAINPNGLEIATTAALFMSLCVVFENHKNLKDVRWSIVLVGFSAAVLANTRALSLLWLALAVTAPILMFGWRPLISILKDKLGLAMTLFIGLGCAASLAWLGVANSFNSLLGGPSSITPDQAFYTMLDRTFVYSSGYIGVMGWLDTPVPGAVIAFWNFAFAALIIGGMSVGKIRSRLGVYMLLVAVILVPAILQASMIEKLGYIWQGRYLLALFALLVLACGVTMMQGPTPQTLWSKSLIRWGLAGAVGVHIYAFLYVLRRFTVGLQATTNWTEMFDPLWQPPLTWQLLSAIFLATLVAGAVVASKFISATNPDDSEASIKHGA